MNLRNLKERLKISDDIPLSNIIFVAVSSFISAFSGLGVQFLITRHFGIDKLGIYAQAYAFSNILATIAVFGLDTCSLKNIAENRNDRIQVNRTFSSLLLLAVFISVIVCAASIPVVLFSSAVKSEEVRKYLFIFILAIPIANINKIFISAINGLYRIKSYSALQIMRYMIILLLLILIIFFKVPFKFVFWIAFANEATLLVITGIYLYTLRIKFDFADCLKNMRIHSAYAAKIFSLTLFTILLGNVDVIISGYFLTNQQVGFLSLPLSIAKGFLLVPAILQINVNPIIAHKAKEKDFPALKEIFNSLFKRNVALVLIMGLVAMAVYPLIPFYLAKIENPLMNTLLFYIMMVPIIYMSAYGFLGGFFVMAGAPKYQFISLACSLGALVIFEPVLLKFFGVTGGALSIGIPYITTVIIITYFLRKKYGIRISLWKA